MKMILSTVCLLFILSGQSILSQSGIDFSTDGYDWNNFAKCDTLYVQKNFPQISSLTFKKDVKGAIFDSLVSFFKDSHVILSTEDSSYNANTSFTIGTFSFERTGGSLDYEYKSIAILFRRNYRSEDLAGYKGGLIGGKIIDNKLSKSNETWDYILFSIPIDKDFKGNEDEMNRLMNHLRSFAYIAQNTDDWVSKNEYSQGNKNFKAILQSNILVIREKIFDPFYDYDEIPDWYPYKYEIVSDERFNEIVRSREPGYVYLDQINQKSQTSQLSSIQFVESESGIIVYSTLGWWGGGNDPFKIGKKFFRLLNKSYVKSISNYDPLW